MKDMVPLGIATSGLAVIAVVVSGALLLLRVLLRGESDYDEGNGFEPKDPNPGEADQHNGRQP